MNERIREVWIKAAREDSDPDNWDTQEQFIERFAQFLIKDAIAVVNRRFMGDMNREDREVRRCVEDLKNHFGIE